MKLNIKSSKFKSFIKRHFSKPATDTKTIEHELHLACAALMFEMIRVDEDIQSTEEEKLFSIIQQQCKLTQDETNELIELARDKMHDAIDYYQFSSLINEHYSQEQKQSLVKHLWDIAYADNVIDKYEEHLVRSLAELLHVPHSAFMKLKHQAQSATK